MAEKGFVRAMWIRFGYEWVVQRGCEFIEQVLRWSLDVNSIADDDYIDQLYYYR